MKICAAIRYILRVKTNTAKVLWRLYPIIKTSEKRIYSSLKKVIPTTKTKETNTTSVKKCSICNGLIDESSCIKADGGKEKTKMSKKDKALLMQSIETQMNEAAKNLDFKRAMELRDILFEMKSNK